MAKLSTEYTSVLWMTVTCESCGFQYEHSYTTSRRVGGHPFGIDAELVAKQVIADIVCATLTGQDIGIRKCPKCGYVQSWMLQSYIERRILLGMLAGFIPGLIASGILFFTAQWPHFQSGTKNSIDDWFGFTSLLACFGLPLITATVYWIRARKYVAKRRNSSDTPESIPPSDVALCRPGRPRPTRLITENVHGTCLWTHVPVEGVALRYDALAEHFQCGRDVVIGYMCPKCGVLSSSATGESGIVWSFWSEFAKSRCNSCNAHIPHPKVIIPEKLMRTRNQNHT
jgi:hypothetical protein